jgi:hypothetical protein
MPTQAEIEQQQLQEYFARQKRNEADSRGKRLMDFGAGLEDVTPYLSMRHPGSTPLRGMADPYCMLKDGEKKRAAWRGPEGGEYLWAIPEGKHSRVVRQAVHQRELTPVRIDEIDPESPYAIIDDKNVDTPQGPQKVVTCDGQCLYRVSLKKSIEWYGMPLNRYKGDLAEMHFGQSDRLRSEGYQTVDSHDLAKITGARNDDSTASNMSVGPAQTEDVLNGPTSNF